MRLSHGLNLAYCTNIHRGESWAETFAALSQHTLRVRDRVCPGQPYAIGLRLSAVAARELSDPARLTEFRRWLENENCYVFTINGFPYGRFHGTRVKEQVYVPDWTQQERVDYTNLLFDLLAEIVPAGMEGSVSTVPCSFKEFITSSQQVEAVQTNLWRSIEHISKLSERTGKLLHLGLEPEPLCFLETSHETVCFFDELREVRPSDDRIARHLGVNYDTCHLAVEFEEPADVLRRFREHNVKLSKLHFSSALKVTANPNTRTTLRAFSDDIYLHQVVERQEGGGLRRYRDLGDALASPESAGFIPEWRIHFHIPLHAPANETFGTTRDHLAGVMDAVAADPKLCSHVEMETYTWEVMPPEMKNRSVVEQLVSEYEWTLGELAARGIIPQ